MRPQSPRWAEDRGVVMAWRVGYGEAGGALILKVGGGGTGAGIDISRECRRRFAAGERAFVDMAAERVDTRVVLMSGGEMFGKLTTFSSHKNSYVIFVRTRRRDPRTQRGMIWTWTMYIPETATASAFTSVPQSPDEYMFEI